MMKYKLIRKPGAPSLAVENALNEAAEEGYYVEFVTNGDYLMSLYIDDPCTTKNGRKEKEKVGQPHELDMAHPDWRPEKKEVVNEPNDTEV